MSKKKKLPKKHQEIQTELCNYITDNCSVIKYNLNGVRIDVAFNMCKFYKYGDFGSKQCLDYLVADYIMKRNK